MADAPAALRGTCRPQPILNRNLNHAGTVQEDGTNVQSASDIISLLVAVTVIALVIVLFIIGRNVTLWYFRINETVTLLTEIRDSLRASQTGSAPAPAQPVNRINP